MEKNNTSQIEAGVESYWLKRKRKRDRLRKERDARALSMLEKACQFYADHYPESITGATWKREKMELSRPTLKDLEQEEALGFRRAFEYYKEELSKKLSSRGKKDIGHGIYRCNQQIADLERINKLDKLEAKMREDERRYEELLHAPEEKDEKLVKAINEEKTYKCQWCGEEFKKRTEILEHVKNCSPENDERKDLKEEKAKEKLFECRYCGVKLPREKIIAHAKACPKREELVEKSRPKEKEEESPELTCEGCGDTFKSAGGLGSHQRYCDEFKELMRNG